jgi:hypothetical protein
MKKKLYYCFNFSYSHTRSKYIRLFLVLPVLFGSWTLEFRLYFRLFFISPLSLCSSRLLPKLLYKHFFFWHTLFFIYASNMLAKNGVLSLPFQYVLSPGETTFQLTYLKTQKGGCMHVVTIHKLIL